MRVSDAVQFYNYTGGQHVGPLAAIVTRVHSSACVDVTVFPPGGGLQVFSSVHVGVAELESYCVTAESPVQDAARRGFHGLQ